MSNTPFSKKCEIMKDYWLEYRQDFASDGWEVIFVYDMGFPAALLYLDEAATLNDKGIGYVEDAWVGMCNYMEVDELGDYDSYSHMQEIADAETWG